MKRDAHLLILLTAILCLISVVASAATVNAPSFAVPSLNERVAALESAVATLQGQVAALLSENAAQQAAINTLQSKLAAANNVLALSPYLTVDTTKNLVLLQGVNIQLVNGTGQTTTANGLGNLIIGYDLARPDAWNNLLLL